MSSAPPCNNGAADAFATREPVDPHDGWTDRLERSKFGNVRATFANLCTIIEHDALTRGRLWRNEMDRGARLDRESITDVFLNTLRERYSRPEPCGAEFATHAARAVSATRSLCFRSSRALIAAGVMLSLVICPP